MLILTSGAWVVGLPVRLEVTGAAPGQSVLFLSGTNLVGAGACPAATAPNCLEVRSPRLLGNDAADPSGTAVLVPTGPPIPNAQLELQATTTGVGNLQSNALIVTLHQAASDNDGDGLTAADEVSLFLTDPAVADTDGGGVTDGDEIALYGTDPNDPSDDVVPLTWTADIYPMLQVECAPCHIGIGLSGGLDLDLYANVVDAPSLDVPAMDRVEPFDTANSYLFHKILGTQGSVGGAGVRMPRGGPYLDALQIALVEDWILTGALE
jgi:hypothetical protein